MSHCGHRTHPSHRHPAAELRDGMAALNPPFSRKPGHLPGPGHLEIQSISHAPTTTDAKGFLVWYEPFAIHRTARLLHQLGGVFFLTPQTFGVFDFKDNSLVPHAARAHAWIGIHRCSPSRKPSGKATIHGSSEPEVYGRGGERNQVAPR